MHLNWFLFELFVESSISQWEGIKLLGKCFDLHWLIGFHVCSQTIERKWSKETNKVCYCSFVFVKLEYLYIVHLRHVILHSTCGRGHVRTLLVISHIPYIDETLSIPTYQVLVVPCKAHWWYLLPRLIPIIMYYLLMRVCLFMLMLLFLLTNF